ncbi:MULTISPECIES: Do family serine endopeptidase [Janthinobacterium]|uniref:Do family serine endopeptidase n=3 Tax=Janthinobacterium TaxID=29580 RepID=A0A031GRL1_9BURK|nr:MULTISPECIES: Do family serine endopeptidase [Janthinobacterium]EZP38575.1 DegP-like periplasmic serine endoprotease [Janthinobacterium lividum]KKO66130.1 Periplasmic pH-dependent serine endoprotease DegQ precursor [Janthinobacterium sp. KBS0711]MBW3499397.1 Do family serine endopeptidase [Janthinobacterium sp. NKUCC08_JDC]MCC7644756.1 Do family serine endopeptidase [Janthinobacterium sp. EB271-G4-3-1]MCC7691838.1 Do family serine endopeptidase [Janthinobacterium sp. EB271-G4-3-2]
MRRFWLLFAQTVTIALALYFVYGALRPASRVQQLGSPAKPVPVVETASSSLAPGSYRDAAARAMPAVVNILTLQVPKRGAHPLARDPFFKRFFGDRDPDDGDDDDLKNSLGSGVIVSHEGYVLTNNHVVEGADEIEVVLTDGRKAPAKVVGLDPETDLAVIKIDLDKLPVIVLGQSELARVGDVVLAIGNPFGVGQTVTMGIISALGRNNLHINSFENFIQTDAAINFGNSGGALVDTRGNLIGINTAIYSQSGGSVGIGFAIPVSTAKTVMEAIIKDGHVVRGWIGVETQDITPELAQSFNLQRTSGAIIAGVVRNGPADKAGIVPGDILLTVQGKPVGDTTEMLNLIAQLPPGEKAKMTVLRKNREAALDVMVGKRPIPKELSK